MVLVGIAGGLLGQTATNSDNSLAQLRCNISPAHNTTGAPPALQAVPTIVGEGDAHEEEAVATTPLGNSILK